ncbi:hypothetical protein C8J57DRAFT_1232295 [Mycena rebaudengoi]|nr:hypothetical protein C8J57DRAFT_1232295 [Mycena rebaudengoi]
MAITTTQVHTYANKITQTRATPGPDTCPEPSGKNGARIGPRGKQRKRTRRAIAEECRGAHKEKTNLSQDRTPVAEEWRPAGARRRVARPARVGRLEYEGQRKNKDETSRPLQQDVGTARDDAKACDADAASNPDPRARGSGAEESARIS